MAKRVNGFEVYRGPSAIDGSEIVVIFTGIKAAVAERKKGVNSKTGAMVASYIMPADVSPVEASRTGEDYGVCGDCPHRGRYDPVEDRHGVDRTCYVTLIHGPRVVWASWKRGIYPVVSVAEAAELLEGLPVRFGAWGDPGAVPAHVPIWSAIAEVASTTTGYTHRHLDTGAHLNGLCMASVDSEVETEEAWALGFATFRVAPTDGSVPRMRGEAICPAAAEAGKVVTCVECPIACNGKVNERVKGRVIIAHGSGKKHFKPKEESG
jgi:hypothetical protein